MTTLSMITQELAFNAPARKTPEPPPRSEASDDARSFRRALDDEQRQTVKAEKPDPEPRKPVSESAEGAASKAEPDRDETTAEPVAKRGEGEESTDDQGQRPSETGGEPAPETDSDDAEASERMAQPVPVIAQSAPDAAQNLPRDDGVKDVASDPSGKSAVRNGAATSRTVEVQPRSAPSGQVVVDSSTQTGETAQNIRETTPAKTANAGQQSKADTAAPGARVTGQTVNLDQSRGDAGGEQTRQDQGRHRHAAPRPGSATPDAAASSSPGKGVDESNASRGVNGAPDALTQLRDLLNRATKQGEASQRDPQTLTPVGARTVQVENALRVEHLTGQPPSTEVQTASRPGPPTPMPAAQLAGALKMDGGEAAMPVRPTADESMFSDRIVRGLSAMVNQRGGVMNMKLHPAELGSLRVQMSIVQGTVTAQFVASTVEAQMMLDRSMGTLRTALESHGLHVERISVAHAPADSSGTSTRHDGQDQQNQQSPGRHHDAGQGESRGRQDEWRQGGRNPAEQEPPDFAGQFQSFEGGLDGGEESEPGVES